MSAPAEDGRKVHKVARGEYLFKILRNHGFEEAEAQAAMNLMARDPKAYGITSGSVHVVYPGDVVTLPHPPDVRQQMVTESEPAPRLPATHGDLPSVPTLPPAHDLSHLPNVDPAQVTAAMDLFEEGSLNRLEELLNLFHERNKAAAAGEEKSAPVQPPAVPSGAPVKVGDLMARFNRPPPPPRMVPSVKDVPAAAPVPVSVMSTLPRYGEPFQYRVLEDNFNVHRPYNPDCPEDWFQYHRCPTCSTGTGRMCVLVKMLSTADIWNDVAESYGSGEPVDEKA